MKKPTIKSQPKPKGVKRQRLPVLRPGEARPVFESLTKSAITSPFDPDPALSRGLEADATEEVSLALQTILAERAANRDRYRVTNDRDYYVLICFQSRDQKLEFLDKTGWLQFGERFIDGLRLARLLGVDVEPINLPMRTYPKPMPRELRKKEVIE